MPLPFSLSSVGTTVVSNVLNSDTQLDPVSKLRVSNPMNLIDTDFEYGLQTTKWETLELVNNVPTFFSRDGDFTITVSNVQTTEGSFDVLVTTPSPHGFLVGTSFIIVGLLNTSAEGSYVTLAVPTTTTFIYKARSLQTKTGSIFDSYTTFLYPARIFQGAQYNLDQIIKAETDGGSQSLITVQTATPNNFKTSTRLLLANSVGLKNIAFDASLIDPANTLSTEYTFTSENNTNLTGYSSKVINPYDWQSRNVLFFSSSDVNTIDSSIDISSTNPFVLGDNVMYIPPIGDTKITGLVPYKIYNLTSTNILQVGDTNLSRLVLNPINANYIHSANNYSNYIPGFRYETSYYTRTTTNSTNTTIMIAASSASGAVQNLTRSLMGSTITSMITTFNQASMDTTINITSSDARNKILYAYFVAKDTGTYTFGIKIKSGTNTASALFAWIGYDNLYNQSPNWANDTSLTGIEAPFVATRSMTAGDIIPMFISVYDSATANIEKIYFTIPGDVTEYSTANVNGFDYIRNNEFIGPTVYQPNVFIGVSTYPGTLLASIPLKTMYNNLATDARPYFYETTVYHTNERYQTGTSNGVPVYAYSYNEIALVGNFIPKTTGTYQFRMQSSTGPTMRFTMYHNSVYNNTTGWNITTTSSPTGALNITLSAGEIISFVVLYSNSTIESVQFSFEYLTPLDATWRSTAIAHNHVYITKNRHIGMQYLYNSTINQASLPSFIAQALTPNNVILNSTAFTRGGYINTFKYGIWIPHTYNYRMIDNTFNSGTMLLYGHFRANSAGSYSFTITKAAHEVVRFMFNDRATDLNSGIYDLSDAGTVSFTLEAGKRYPFAFLITRNTTGTASCRFSYTIPGNATIIYSSNFQGWQYIESPIIDETNPYTVSSTSVNITDSGTSNYGVHSLHKVYLINGITSPGSAPLLRTTVNTNNYTGGLGAGDRVIFFSGETDLELGYSSYALRTSRDNISKTNFSYAFIKTNPTIGTSSTNLSITRTLGGSIFRIDSQYLSSISWMVPAYQLLNYDSFYFLNHGLPNNAALIFQNLTGTVPSGLVNNTTYYANVISSDLFRLKTSPTGTEIDITSLGNGDKKFVYNYDNPFRDTIYTENHGLVNSAKLIYSNNGNPSITGLTNGTTYYVTNATQNRFKLSSTLGGTIIDLISAGTGTHIFTASQNATDGNYVIESSENSTTFKLRALFEIPVRSVIFEPATVLNLVQMTFIIAKHGMTTGARVTYNSNGNTVISGLVNNTDYYIIRTDLDAFRIALTRENALNGTFITMNNLGSGTNHIMYFPSVCGEIETSSNVQTTNGNTLITAPNEDFLTSKRLGDFITIQYDTTQTVLSGSTVDISSDTITLTGTHGLVDGDAIRYTSTSGVVPGLILNAIYYVKVTGLTTSQITLYYTPSDQQSSSNRIDIAATTNITNARFTTLRPNTIFKSKIKEIKSPKIAEVYDAPSITSSAARYINITMLLPRNDGSVLHRPYDGGIMIIPSNNPDASIIRQTRKYFRYQSGKGIQVSKAVNFSAPTELQKYFKKTGNIIQCTTRYVHRLSPGLKITVFGSETNQNNVWNGVFTIQDILDETNFTIQLASEPTDIISGGFPSFYVNSWNNSSLRAGLFDDQNGMFYEYDGDQLYAVRRNSIQQLQGTATVIFGSALVIGEGTNFFSQLVAGDFIVIKGTSYKVSSITSGTEMYILPSYRGISNINVTITKTIDYKVPQSQWNIDKFDGSGPSGYVINIHKIQMIFIDYSWYGAGSIRFGFKTGDGKIVYGHKIINNNILTEAYMRSGNLPGRYEVTNTDIPSYVPALMHWGTSVIMDGRMDDDKAYWFTASGDNLSFSGPNPVTFSANTTSGGITAFRGIAPGTKTLAYRLTCNNFSEVSGIQPGTLLTAITPTTGLQAGTKTVGYPSRYQGSLGYLYIDKTYSGTGGSTTATVQAGESEDIPTLIPLVSIRLSPSVDNGRVGVLGSREVITRMQLALKSVGVLTTHDSEIIIILNTFPYNKNWKTVQFPSLSQTVAHTKNETIDGGTTIFSFRVQGGTPDSSGKRFANATTVDIQTITDLGNSILGGDDTYPNGPDILTVAAKVIDFSGISAITPLTLSGRITWTESQA